MNNIVCIVSIQEADFMCTLPTKLAAFTAALM